MGHEDLAVRLRKVLPIAAGLAAQGTDYGLAFFIRIEAELAKIEATESALDRAVRLAKNCHLAD